MRHYRVCSFNRNKILMDTVLTDINVQLLDWGYDWPLQKPGEYSITFLNRLCADNCIQVIFFIFPLIIHDDDESPSPLNVFLVVTSLIALLASAVQYLVVYTITRPWSVQNFKKPARVLVPRLHRHPICTCHTYTHSPVPTHP